MLSAAHVTADAWAQQPAGGLRAHAALAVTLALALSALVLRRPGNAERRRRRHRHRRRHAPTRSADAHAAAAEADPCAVPLLADARGTSYACHLAVIALRACLNQHASPRRV